MNDSKKSRKDIPPPVFSDDPGSELEEQLRQNPKDLSTKADVGSDESMDASDPSSAVQAGNQEPVPSSSFPEKQDEEGAA